MSITVKDVEHVANLARLELSEKDKELFTEQLNSILEFAEKLNELDTENVPPTSHVLDIKNVVRKDEVKQSLPREEALRNAPSQEEGHFKVPAIIE
ncbi:Asp-tRNA(Asn)/Glu-tRNA(Gln) amidotransferase subunit GatC [Desulfuribacillus alkaliarsenatis]|uniref:Aspartyl/glutamyl-tRNA(Asn/Gln) amidotransferase subunit C n=1 Tax=Desulfuribacillus alkaliarsenatis TaxID=766136 RepID=A0A1E5G2A4_9FIRM|nr:Asp-tRNA(Asn)/Glu-tRNA(Gln) amidotransferase subunit GatC [Desulfuribacillus alkaliarsenatis]OEF97033.1 asparaginyl/glutamyl-tRNA amidotransferase subunit C [Desulfuribacillus alkaliarsenatis]